MSVYSGPEINESGLVLSIDMGNTDKSFRGANTTNIFWHPTPDASGNVQFQFNGTGTFKKITSGNYGGYDIISSDIVYRMDFTTDNGCYYHGNRFDGTVSVGDVYTFSFDYYISPTTTGYTQVNFLGNIEIYDQTSPTWTYIGGAGFGDPTPSVIGVWKRATMTATVGSVTVAPAMQYFLYPGACNPSRLANTGFILYKNPQMEKRSFASPFVANTRSNTQSVIDITGLNTVTANNLVYNSNNTFSFNGANSSISVSNNSNLLFTGTSPYTLEAWVYPAANPGASNWTGIFNRENAATGSRDGYNLYFLGSATTSTYFVSERWSAGTNYNNSILVDSSVSCNAWNHIVVTYNGTNLIMYRNGSSISSVSALGNINNTTKTLDIGRRDINYFNGRIAKAQVFNRALSAAEIRQMFNALRGRFGL